MRRFVTVGVFSVAAVVYAACSDDGGDGTIGTGGSGGTGGVAGSGSGASAGQAGSAGTGNVAGSAGTAGQGGTAGAGTGGSAGAAGSAGTAGSGGNDPDAGDGGVVEGDGGLGDAGGDASLPPPCTGCLELSALNMSNTGPTNISAFFQLGFSGDMSTTTVTFRLGSLVLDETGQIQITPFATSFDGTNYTQGNGTTVLSNAAGFPTTFVDVAMNLGAIPTGNGFDPATVVAFGLQVFAGATFAGPDPKFILDSITYTNPATGLTDLDFTTDAQNFAVNQYAGNQSAVVIHH